MPFTMTKKIYYSPTSKKMMLSAQRIAAEKKYPDGSIAVPTGYVQFEDHFLRSNHATQALHDQGHEGLKESIVVQWLENSQPFKNGKFYQITQEQVEQYNHARAQIFNLATGDSQSVPEDVVTAAQRGITKMPEPVEETEETEEVAT